MSAEGWCCQNTEVGVGEENQGMRPLQTVIAYQKDTPSKQYTTSVSTPGKFPPCWHSAVLSAPWLSSSQAELVPSFSSNGLGHPPAQTHVSQPWPMLQAGRTQPPPVQRPLTHCTALSKCQLPRVKGLGPALGLFVQMRLACVMSACREGELTAACT